MTVSAYLPLLLAGLFGLVGPGLGRRLPPGIATWLLSAGGLLAAAGSCASLALLSFGLIAQTPVLAARGHWSDSALRHDNPLVTPVGVAATIAILLLTVQFLRVSARRAAAVRDAYLLARSLPPGGELAVLDTAEPQAFAVPGRPGRIVVSTGLLRGLDASQRRALLAHERAHLHHRHHVHQTVAQLASALNPLLRRLPAALDLCCERWADEDAAIVCRRDTVAETLTRAATTARRIGPAVVLAAAAADVAARIGALRAPAPRLTWWRIALLIGLLLSTATAVVMAMHDTEQLFELAQTAYRTGQR